MPVLHKENKVTEQPTPVTPSASPHKFPLRHIVRVFEDWLRWVEKRLVWLMESITKDRRVRRAASLRKGREEEPPDPHRGHSKDLSPPADSSPRTRVRVAQGSTQRPVERTDPPPPTRPARSGTPGTPGPRPVRWKDHRGGSWCDYLFLPTLLVATSGRTGRLVLLSRREVGDTEPWGAAACCGYCVPTAGSANPAEVWRATAAVHS
ncbi:hypothetical protein GN956_G17761 [Arapaima gigas]